MTDTPETTEPETEAYPPTELAARDVAGVPHVHIQPLTVMRFSGEGACHFVPESGIYAGVLCYDDTVLTFNPIVAPRMMLSAVTLAIEITSYDEFDGAPTTSLKVVYLSRDGKTRGLVTSPVPADGEVIRVQIPTRHVRPETVLATAVKIVLMDEIPSGQSIETPSGVRGSGKRPILVRGAWLEFPFTK